MGWTASGTWQGHYTYDPLPDCPDPPARVGFGMRLRQSWLFGSLRGEVWDDPPDGMPSRGVVEGRVTGAGVSFLKWMPVSHVLGGPGLGTYAEYLLREFGLPLDGPVPHPPIRYTGEYQPDTGELAGVWEFVPGTTRVVSRGEPLEVENPVATGRWVARRVDTDGAAVEPIAMPVPAA